MLTVRLGTNCEVRFPALMARRLKLRPGTPLAVFSWDHTVSLVPMSRIPKSQRYFYTEEWQKKEREADEAIRSKKIFGPFSDAASTIRALRRGRV